MSRLKTKEDLQKMFQESKERHKNKKRQYTKRTDTKEQTPTMKTAFELVKKIQLAKKNKERQLEAQGAVRKKTVDNDTTNTEKTSQRALKQARVWHNPLTEKATNECDLYLTREELQAAEARGEGKILWDNWDRLVAECRANIEAAVKELREKNI